MRDRVAKLWETVHFQGEKCPSQKEISREDGRKSNNGLFISHCRAYLTSNHKCVTPYTIYSMSQNGHPELQEVGKQKKCICY